MTRHAESHLAPSSRSSDLLAEFCLCDVGLFHLPPGSLTAAGTAACLQWQIHWLRAKAMSL